jgi:hypothetical protein
MSTTIESSLSHHPTIGILQAAGLLREVVCISSGSEIESSSDAKWPLPVQQAWPFYIMGASRMVLELVERLRTHPRPSYDDLPIEVYATYYMHIVELLTHTWQNHGRHAFLHHLNALFGYVALEVPTRSGPLSVHF